MTQWAPAQQAYFQAYQLQPDNPDYAYNLAVGLEHLSQPKLALTYYRQALELGNMKGHAGFDSARVQERIGQLTARIGNQLAQRPWESSARSCAWASCWFSRG